MHATDYMKKNTNECEVLREMLDAQKVAQDYGVGSVRPRNVDVEYQRDLCRKS
jgi:hypothetical protein